MIKLKNININFNLFKKYKKIVLINGLVVTTSITGFAFYKKSDTQNLNYTKKSLEKVDDSCIEHGPQFEDYTVWVQDNKNRQAVIACYQLSPSDTYRIRVLRGNAKSTHYRVEGENHGEYSKWEEIPNNNLITVRRQELPKIMQYEKLLKIRFGKYNEKTDTIDEENVEDFVYEKVTKEQVQNFNEARRRIEVVAASLVEESDQTVNKVKKIYDYLIEHTEYRWDPKRKDITSYTLFNKYYMDCHGYASFMNIALNYIGIESFSVCDNTHGHIWNIVNVDGKYYHLDATYSDTSSYENTSKYRYFLVSDSSMLADHRYFVPEKDVKCEEIYDLTGIVSNQEVKYRGLKGEEITYPTAGLLGEIEEGAYNLPFRSK